MLLKILKLLAPSMRAASFSDWSKVAIPVKKIIELVPTIDQIKVIATANSAPFSDERKSVFMKPRPKALKMSLSRPSCAKKRIETIPMTTQEIAVGRK